MVHHPARRNRVQPITDYSGQRGRCPLNERGRRPAGDFFAAYRHIAFDSVYTSALIRTQETVQPFLDLGILHVKLPELNEIFWGSKDGTRIEPGEMASYGALVND